MRGLFFDLDGTLVDTHQSNTSAYLNAVHDVLPEASVSRVDLLRYIKAGKGYREFLSDLISGISDVDIISVSNRKSEIYPKYLGESRLNEVLVSRMKKWKEDPNAILVLVTTAKECNARNILEHHGILDVFDFAVFGDQVTAPKPNPEIYLKALELAGVDASDAEAFEDSDVGIEAARAAGISVTRVVWDES